MGAPAIPGDTAAALRAGFHSVAKSAEDTLWGQDRIKFIAFTTSAGAFLGHAGFFFYKWR